MLPVASAGSAFWELSTLRSPIFSRSSTSSCLVRVCLQLSQQYVMSLKAVTVKSAHTALFAIGTLPPLPPVSRNGHRIEQAPFASLKQAGAVRPSAGSTGRVVAAGPRGGLAMAAVEEPWFEEAKATVLLDHDQLE